MSPEELCDAGVALYGQWGWQTRMAEDLGVDYSTVKRWVAGTVEMSGPSIVAVRLMLRVRELEADLKRRPRKAPRRKKET